MWGIVYIACKTYYKAEVAQHACNENRIVIILTCGLLLEFEHFTCMDTALMAFG